MRVAAVLALCVLSTMASATDYYVRASSGKDTNDGRSPSKPFKTIGKAMATAQSGDTVYIAPGTYKESMSTPRGGDAGQQIRFVGDKTGVVFGVKKGTVRVQSGSGADGLTIRHPNITVENLQFYKCATGVVVQECTGALLIGIDAVKNAQDGVRVTAASAELRSSLARSNGDNGVEAGAAGVLTIRGGSFYSNTRAGVLLGDASADVTAREVQIYSNKSHGAEARHGNLRLTNCLIRNNSSDGVHLGAPGVSAPVLTLWHCTIARNKGDGLEQEAGSATFMNSILAYNTGVGLKVSAGTITHNNNLFFSNSAGQISGTSQASAERIASPAFSSKNNYTLLPSSAAINLGASAADVTASDLVAAVRPRSGGWDAGCYEGVGPSIFTDVAGTIGFSVVTAGSENDGSGLHWVDLDDDGDLDCIATGANARVLTSTGSSFSGTLLGAFRGQGVILDANGDRRPDFAAFGEGRASGLRLFLNEEGQLAGEDIEAFSDAANAEGAAGADTNADGRLDLVAFGTNGNWVGPSSGASTPTFSANKLAGLNPAGGAGNGDFCSSADINGDGAIDLFYHYGGGRLFLSDSSSGFSLSPATSGRDPQIALPTSPNKKQGSAWGDFDGDGDLDLFVARRDGGELGALYENDDGAFTDVSEDVGLEESEGQRGCTWGDCDNDGDLDLFVATRSGGCQLYENIGGVLVLSGRGAEVDVDAQDAVFVDYDNDGDLDIALTRTGGGMMLLRNSTNNDRYLKVRALGAGRGGTNTLGVGTRIEVYDGSGELVGRRDIGVARGYGGTEPLWAHFGGVDPAQAYTVKVYFKSGVQTAAVTPRSSATSFGARVVPQMVTIREPDVVPNLRVVRWRESTPDE